MKSNRLFFSLAPVLMAELCSAFSRAARALPLPLLVLMAELCSASVPVAWPVETTRPAPAAFDCFQGETLALEAALTARGTPLQLPTNAPALLFWQTNGMETAWWSAPASVSNNVIRADWLPAYDCGARAYSCFLGITGSVFRAAFNLRMRHAPGASPNVIAKPVPILDLANTTVINPPWPTDETIAATVRRVIEEDGIQAGTDGLAVTNIASGLISAATNSLVVAETDPTVPAWAKSAIPNFESVAFLGIKALYSRETAPMLFYSDVGLDQNGTKPFSFSWAGGDSTLVPDGSPVVTSNILASSCTVLSAQAESISNSLASSCSALAAMAASNSNRLDAVTATVSGEDAKVIVTNYNSATRLPELELSAKVTENGSSTWLDLWKEMTRWNAFTGTNFNWSAWAGFHAFSTNLTYALANKADVLYGYYDGATGTRAPDGYFWIGQPKVAICGGASYVRHLTTDGEVWILESNGNVTDLNTTTNGFFRITDSEGNVHFEIVKGAKRLVYASANSMVQTNSTHFLVHYAITNALSAPVAYAATNLASSAFAAETEASCPASVTWHQVSDGYDLEFWAASSPCPKLFVYASYETGGASYIRHNDPVAMEYVYLFGQKWAVGTNTISGHVVLTLTPAN